MHTSATDRVGRFLEGETIPLYIDGQWQPAADGQTIEVQDPSTGARIAEVAAAQAPDVDAAVQAATAAFGGWSELSASERAVILHRLADAIERNTEELARLESMDVGKPIGDARGFDVPFSAEAFRYYADLAVSTRYREPLALKEMAAHQLRVPYGVCACIVPWNFPFMLLAWGTAPALAAGNTVVIKPAELTPLSSLFLCELAAEAAVPAGVLNVVPGVGEQAGASLAAHPQIKRLAFTGSPEVGRMVAAAAAANLVPAKLELGGKGAAVVFEDVDVDSTAQALVDAITLNAGQVCCTATRWVVQEPIFDRFLDAVRSRLGAVRLGSGIEEATTMGPVVSEGQRQRILRYLRDGQEQGASVLAGGGEARAPGYDSGFFVNPTVLTGPAENVCVREEIFGPVAYMLPFKAEAGAIELVNSSQYGLANSVWSSDLQRAERVASSLVAGNSWINAHNVFAYGLPYGGVNLSGFGGGVNGVQTYFDYLRHQTIARPLA